MKSCAEAIGGVVSQFDNFFLRAEFGHGEDRSEYLFFHLGNGMDRNVVRLASHQWTYYLHVGRDIGED